MMHTAPSAAVGPHAAPPLKYFTPIAMLFTAVLLMSNIASQKLFVWGPFTLSCGIVVFPVSYIFGDVLTEVYGYARSRTIIWGAMLCLILATLVFELAIALPPAPGWTGQAAFEATLGNVPRTVIASILAYFCGEFSNSYTLAKMKVLTRGRYLWTRTIGSTVVGEGVDTAVFNVVAFAGVFAPEMILHAALSAYVMKVLYEVAATPVTYVVVAFLKREEGVDVYDTDTNFNPFHA